MKSKRVFILPIFIILFLGHNLFSQKFSAPLKMIADLDSVFSGSAPANSGLSKSAVQGDFDKNKIFTRLQSQLGLKKSSIQSGSFAKVNANSDWLADLLVKTSGHRPDDYGTVVSSYGDGVYRVLVPVSRLNALKKEPWLEKADISIKLSPLNDNAVAYTNGWVMQAAGYNGDSVICGIIDTGIDYTHPAFRNPDGTTRILRLWDQTDDTTGTPPAGYNYGREYTDMVINQDLQSGNYHSIVNQRDLSGHGTMIAGSFAGRNDQLDPQTDPKLDGNARNGNLVVVKTNFTSNYILDAAQYIFDIASTYNRPAVIVLAGGTQLGPHDGSDNFTSTLSNLAGPGRIIVQSAGNNGNDSIHVHYTVLPQTSQTFNFQIKSKLNLGYYLLGYYDISSQFRVTLRRPNGRTIVCNYGSTALDWFGLFFEGIFIYITNNSGNSGDNEVLIYIKNGNAGSYQVTLENQSSGTTPSADFHAWIANDTNIVMENPTDPVIHGSSYTTTQYQYTLVSNACSQNLIVTGGYLSRMSWHTLGQPAGTNWILTDGGLGGIAPFSSHGPTRVGIQKPDVSASAGIILSTKSGDITFPNNYPWGPDETYTNYNYYFGTSFSAAIVAGGIAQLLEKYPTWGPSDFQNYFQNYSQPSQGDVNAGLKTNPGVWDPAFGYGVLDLTEEAWYYPKTMSQTTVGTYDIIVGTKKTATVNIRSFQADSFQIDLYTHSIPPFMPPGSKALPRYYVIEPKPSYGSVNADVTLYYTDAEFQQAGFTNSTEADLALYRYHNGAWIYVGGLVDTVNNSITAYNVSEFSIWAIASLNEASLPVDVVTLNAYRTEDGIVLQWQTKAEFDVAGYEILRSTEKDGEYQLIASYRQYPSLRSKGNSNLGFSYEYLDESAEIYQTYYYKILAVDIDGSVKQFGPVETSDFQVDVDVVDASVVNEFRLSPPYPNPFNPEASIVFSIRKIPGKTFIPVRIAVYNLLGQEVAKLYNGELPTGTFRIKWDASQLPAGMYIIHMLTPYWQNSQKAVLVK